MGRTRENQGIYSLNSWEKGAAVSERRKAQLRTLQRLQHRIKQHVPKWLQQQAKRPTRSQPSRSCKLKRNNPDCDSAIGQHLLDNEQCAANYNNKHFKILAVARNSFHLCLLEATFIKTKHPVLCKQKEFVYTLKLFK